MDDTDLRILAAVQAGFPSGSSDHSGPWEIS